MSTSDSEIITSVLSITNNYQDVLSMEDAVKLNLHAGPKNGAGNRSKLSKLFDHFTIYGDNRTPYSPNGHKLTPENEEIIGKFKETHMGSRGACGFLLLGLNDKKSSSRPICTEIKRHYSKIPCVRCGSTRDLICDHKNDLYNDPRVLTSKTQTKDDFQSLCNACNLIKRGASQKRDKEGKRQPPPPDIVAANGGILYTKGDESYDPNDPNALVGTYWYDPIEFGKQCIVIRNIDLRKKLCNAGIPSETIDSIIDG